MILAAVMALDRDRAVATLISVSWPSPSIAILPFEAKASVRIAMLALIRFLVALDGGYRPYPSNAMLLDSISLLPKANSISCSPC